MSRQQELREIIRRATGTDRTDLAKYVLFLRIKADGPRWAKTKDVAHHAGRLRHKLQKLSDEVMEFDRDVVAHSPYVITDPEAAADASTVMKRAEPLAQEIEVLANDRLSDILSYEHLKQQPHRDWPAYFIALSAAFVYHDITETDPGFWNDKNLQQKPYMRMVSELFGHFDITIGTEAPIRWAMEEFKKTS